MADKYQLSTQRLAPICALLLLIVALPGCSSGPDEGEVKAIADMEMRAIELREQRFALANDIRFAQDTLIALDSTGAHAEELKARLQTMGGRKDSLSKVSLALADSIRQRLASAIDPKHYSQEERAEFNEKLSAEMKRRGGTATN